MIDLTPLDVRKKKGDFRKKPLGGYDIGEVDNFLKLVEERLQGLVTENLSLSERLQLMESRLEVMEGREAAIQEALVSAQELKKEVQAQTKREIVLFRKEAEAEIESRLIEADELLRERQRALEELERTRRKFLKAYRSVLERELESVEVEEGRQPLEKNEVFLQLKGWTRRGSDAPQTEGELGGPGGLEETDPLWLGSRQDEGDEDTPAEEEGGD
jgi:cell division initiation protein